MQKIGRGHRLRMVMRSKYQNCCSVAVDRYLRSALEYAYALRKEQASVNFHLLVCHVENHIQDIKHTLSVPMLMKPLEEVIHMPINLADFWMVSLLSLDHIESRVLH